MEVCAAPDNLLTLSKSENETIPDAFISVQYTEYLNQNYAADVTIENLDEFDELLEMIVSNN